MNRTGCVGTGFSLFKNNICNNYFSFFEPIVFRNTGFKKSFLFIYFFISQKLALIRRPKNFVFHPSNAAISTHFCDNVMQL